MTLVSAIIKRAYRETNLIPLASDPSANQSTEALEHLNPIILSSVGYEAGDGLTDLNYSSGPYNQSEYVSEWIDDNIRLVLSLEADTELDLDPRPYEGQRVAIVDTAGNLATNTLTLNGNGRTIEGASSVLLDTNSLNRQWMYRGDTGNWVRINELTTSDQMPFPVEYDPYFIIMLAARLNPAYGQSLSAETVKMLDRARSSIRSRYTRKDFMAPTDPGLVDTRERIYSSSMQSFNIGRPRPYF